MHYLHAFILAVIQGLTEFIPISSSGHLAVTQYFLKFSEPPVAFDLVLHLGTLAAVMIYYRHDLRSMARDAAHPAVWLHPNAPTDSSGKLLSLLVIACVPTAIIGFAFESQVEAAFSDMRSVGIEFILGGIIMAVTLLRKNQNRDLAGMRVSDAIIIGVLQGVSIFPAISRSGATIAAALLLGIRPDMAGRFSFLLSIPAILGACLLEAKDIMGELQTGPDFLLYTLSAVVAGVVGYLSIKPLIRILQAAKFHYFAYYCWATGAALLVYLGFA